MVQNSLKPVSCSAKTYPCVSQVNYTTNSNSRTNHCLPQKTRQHLDGILETKAPVSYLKLKVNSQKKLELSKAKKAITFLYLTLNDFLLSLSSIFSLMERNREIRLVENFNRLKLPYQRNNPNNPQKDESWLNPARTEIVFFRHSRKKKRKITTELPLSSLQNHPERQRYNSQIATKPYFYHSTKRTWNRSIAQHTKSYYDNFWWYTFLMPTMNFRFCLAQKTFLPPFFLSVETFFTTSDEAATNNQFLVVFSPVSAVNTNVVCNIFYL